MYIDTDKIVTMTAANQNFSAVARQTDRDGRSVIFKNNRPKYILIDLDNGEYLDLMRGLICPSTTSYSSARRTGGARLRRPCAHGSCRTPPRSKARPCACSRRTAAAECKASDATLPPFSQNQRCLHPRRSPARPSSRASRRLRRLSPDASRSSEHKSTRKGELQ